MNLKHLKSVALLTIYACLIMAVLINCNSGEKNKKEELPEQPNILILMADNQVYRHLGAYGDPVVSTPNIDKVAKEGVTFTHAFSQSPSCSPARAAMLTGRNVWEMEEAANLWGGFPSDLTVISQLLEKEGYHVGIEGKGWGPGNYEASGWEENPGGERYNTFEEFYNMVDRGQPWMYWFSSRSPHRPFKQSDNNDIDLDKIEVPPYLLNAMPVKKDMADYYTEIESFDGEVGHLMSLVGEMGELENTIVIILSDNGWQMPRGLANLYDAGTRIPLIISWPKQSKKERKVDDFVLMNDFAPTLLELAGASVPEEMTAKSFVDILESDEDGLIDEDRDYVVLARERHAFVRENGLGYPARAIRTKDYLYIHNYAPDRWPAGDPPLYGDVDAHMLQYPSPTKMYMLKNRDEEKVKPLFELAFGKRPAEELYDLSDDPYQMENVADQESYQQIKTRLSDKLSEYLEKTGDPREGGPEFDYDKAEYYMDVDKKPRPSEKAKKALNLKDEYDYLDGKLNWEND